MKIKFSSKNEAMNIMQRSNPTLRTMATKKDEKEAKNEPDAGYRAFSENIGNTIYYFHDINRGEIESILCPLVRGLRGVTFSVTFLIPETGYDIAAQALKEVENNAWAVHKMNGGSSCEVLLGLYTAEAASVKEMDLVQLFWPV